MVEIPDRLLFELFDFVGHVMTVTDGGDEKNIQFADGRIPKKQALQEVFNRSAKTWHKLMPIAAEAGFYNKR
jgi:hypothetical protein